jgi:hypothetical protein
MIGLAYFPPWLRHLVRPLRTSKPKVPSVPIFTAREAAEPHDEHVAA